MFMAAMQLSQTTVRDFGGCHIKLQNCDKMFKRAKWLFQTTDRDFGGCHPKL